MWFLILLSVCAADVKCAPGYAITFYNTEADCTAAIAAINGQYVGTPPPHRLLCITWLSVPTPG